MICVSFRTPNISFSLGNTTLVEMDIYILDIEYVEETRMVRHNKQGTIIGLLSYPLICIACSIFKAKVIALLGYLQCYPYYVFSCSVLNSCLQWGAFCVTALKSSRSVNVLQTFHVSFVLKQLASVTLCSLSIGYFCLIKNLLFIKYAPSRFNYIAVNLHWKPRARYIVLKSGSTNWM